MTAVVENEHGSTDGVDLGSAGLPTDPPHVHHQGDHDMATTTLIQTTAKQLDGQATTMRAIVQDRYGSPDVLKLQQVAKPAVGLDDVLVRVRAAGLHIGDWHVMTGQPYLMRI